MTTMPMHDYSACMTAVFTNVALGQHCSSRMITQSARSTGPEAMVAFCQQQTKLHVNPLCPCSQRLLGEMQLAVV